MAEGLFADINRAKDPKNLNDLEKKHLPVIEAPKSVKKGVPFDVTIEVGKLLKHPNELDHHIEWIVLLNGSVTLAIVELTPVSSSPKVTLRISLDKSAKLRALERCNLHGEWEHVKEVKVE